MNIRNCDKTHQGALQFDSERSEEQTKKRRRCGL